MVRSRKERTRRRQVRREALETMQRLSDEELKNLRHELGREIGLQARVINELRTRQDAVKLEIERRDTKTPAGIHISDHALVRYLERVKGVDVEGARAEIGEMAARAQRERDGRTGRRRDSVTGLVIGVDEETTVVTTVFAERELPVFET